MIIFVFIQEEYTGIILLCEYKTHTQKFNLEYVVFSENNLYNRSIHVERLQLKSIFIAIRFKELEIWKQLHWKVLA